jgi:hypothetical protein
MESNYDGATLTPKDIVDAFQRAYRKIYGREAQVVHMFAEWYTVNGETVHRMTLFREISRLNDLVKQQAIIAQQQQEQFVQQMWYAEQQAQAQQAQYEQEQLAQQQQFAVQAAGVAPQPEPQPVQPQRQFAKPNADRGMLQRLIARLRGA